MLVNGRETTVTVSRLVRAGRPGMLLAICALLLAVSAAACGSSGAKQKVSSPSTAVAAGSTITIAGFGFGSPLTVKPGDQVAVKNNDSVTHTVTADDGKSFSVSVAGNGTASFAAPSTPGTYPFHCTVHPQMHGSLVVKA